MTSWNHLSFPFFWEPVLSSENWNLRTSEFNIALTKAMAGTVSRGVGL